ncbi:MAG: hypothetical protein K5780_00355 [Alphaproteobacteria bacterium]|nr:hypothetical protein [Alphaproteobacteria bacterium]
MRWFSKIDGENQQHKNRKKSNSFISQISKLSNYFTKKLKVLRSVNYGSILVEFAICIPIFITSTSYIHDVVKLKRHYSQTEFVAQQIVNIIQNISKKRGKDKKEITQQDLMCAMSLSSLTTHPGNTRFSGIDEENMQKSISVPVVIVNYVKGENGKASVKHSTFLVMDGHSPFDSFCYPERGTNWDQNFGEYAATKAQLNADSTDIYPTLKIQDGEEKIIMETAILSASGTGEALNDKKDFGFFLLSPKFLGNDYRHSSFTSIVIFRPNKNLFNPDNGPESSWVPPYDNPYTIILNPYDDSYDDSYDDPIIY